MNILSALYTIIITPIETIIEAVFSFELTIVGFMGVAGAIIAVSMVMNFLALPIYVAADKIQEDERVIQSALAPDIAHIKKAFTGDERFMLLSTLYRQNHYHPIMALRSSLSIILEIPFFIAAYHFLSHCSALRAVGFGPFADLGAPDALIAVGGVHLNLLPILMTGVNAVSAAVYLKGFPIRDKIQTYALAAVFLVLLYNSPSGLVFYWILNNLFSLAKNVVTAYCKKPLRVVHAVITASMAFVSVYILSFGNIHNKIYRISAVALTLIVAVLPFMGKAIVAPLAKISRQKHDDDSSGALLLLISSCIGCTLLCGLVLPSNAVATNPVEFSFIGEVSSPLHYIWRDLAIFSGFFIFWPLVVYKMFGDKVKLLLPRIAAFMFIMAVLDAIAFKYNYGLMNIYFKLDNPSCLKNYSAFFVFVPLALSFFVAASLIFVKRMRLEHHLVVLIMASCFAQVIYSGLKVGRITRMYNEYVAMNPDQKVVEQDAKIKPFYHLSKTGRNVIVFYIDSTIGALFPYIMQEFPDMNRAYDGFTFYPNTVSQGSFTLIASSLMCGGYDYTVEEINKRPDVLLKDKHNEALLLLPRLFSDAGYHVTVQDPPFSNYAWTGDATPYLPYPNIDCKFMYKNFYAPYINHMGNTQGASFPPPELIIAKHSMAFCALQAALPMFRSAMYDSTMYMQLEKQNEGIIQYAHLYFLPQLTDASSDEDTFMFLCNDLPHEPTILQSPNYEPAVDVDKSKVTTGTYPHKTDWDIAVYHVNAAAILRTGAWLDRLRELGVYDNTRIIIVGDHGKYCTMSDEAHLDSNRTAYNPLLLFKDFDAHGAVRTDNQFMTNGDVPFLAKEGLGLSNENPFTHTPLVQNKKLFKAYSVGAGAKLRNAEMKEITTWKIDNATIYTVHDNIFDENNWHKE